MECAVIMFILWSNLRWIGYQNHENDRESCRVCTFKCWVGQWIIVFSLSFIGRSFSLYIFRRNLKISMILSIMSRGFIVNLYICYFPFWTVEFGFLNMNFHFNHLISNSNCMVVFLKRTFNKNCFNPIFQKIYVHPMNGSRSKM